LIKPDSDGRIIELGETGTSAIRVRHIDGSWRHVEATSINLVDDPAVGGIVCHMRDVTDRVLDASRLIVQAAEAAENKAAADRERHALEDRIRQSERLESLGQLAGGIAHDFNNLLGVILNYAEFVIEQSESIPQVRADAVQIQAAAERAAALTRQLLIFARRETLELVSLDVNALVGDLETLLSRSLGEHVELVVQPGLDVPMVWADRGQMEQILVNLAVNARDAMPEGGSLTIETGMSELDLEYSLSHPGVEPGRYAELTVSDTGGGMGPDVVPHIFEPFFTTKPQGEGTGLGLATLHGIVRAAGGAVNVYSEEGIGTTFRVYIPASESPADAAQSVSLAPAPQGHGETVLVVEDEKALLEVTSRMLRRNGYEVSEASSCREALTLIADCDFQLLLTDVVMPEMSGRELASEVLAADQGTAVLYMSGYSAGVLGPRLMIDDDVALIQKPFTQLALLNKVRDVLASPIRRTAHAK
jgi:hypothetical protein